MRYEVNANTFMQLPYTTGTIQNVSNTDIEISNEQTIGTGIVLKAGETFAFNNATVYACARPVLNGGTGIISVVPFNGEGEGGESPIYVPKGSIAFASLPTTLNSTMLGWTYNVSDAFTTDNRFVEGSGVDYPAGENVVVVEAATGVFKYDCFGGAYILPVANTTTLGGVKSSAIDGKVSVDNDGVMAINLPTASMTVKGGAKIGTGFSMSGEVLNLDVASTSALGGIKVGTGIEVANEKLNVKVATATEVAGVLSSADEGKVTVNNDGTMTYNPLGYRQPSTTYAVGNIAYLSALGMQKLVCVKAGTTASGDVAPSTTEGALITDGTVVWQVDSLADGNYTAIHQNGIAGGRNITAYWQSGIMSTNIQAGIFVGMHIGDHIVKTVTTAATTYTDKSGVERSQAEATYSNRNWIVAGINSQFKVGNGDGGQGTTQNHIVLISDTAMQASAKMNPTNDTTGGYLGSDMWRIQMPIWANAIKNAFGDSHVLTHKELLSNAINSAGTASDYAWVDVDVNIPNEVMVQGFNLFGTYVDTTTWAIQLPYFALFSRLITNIRSSYWLRNVAGSTGFAAANLDGYVRFALAGKSIDYGSIRPYFLIH